MGNSIKYLYPSTYYGYTSAGNAPQSDHTVLTVAPEVDEYADLGDFGFPDGRDGKSKRFEYYLCPSCLLRKDDSKLKTSCSSCNKDINVRHFSCAACSYRDYRCMMCGCDMIAPPFFHEDEINRAYQQDLLNARASNPAVVEKIRARYMYLQRLLHEAPTMRDYFRAAIPVLVQERRDVITVKLNNTEHIV